MTDYDVVEYSHQPVPQAQPDRLAVMATLFGMQPASPLNCRVLELGCGSGGSLIPLADLFPESTFFGVDLSAVAIAQGHKRIDALGLGNLRLEQMDLMDFPADAGEFDYIVAHGLFSWVPAPVRERILAILQRHLAPQGIAYISYNAYPGCHIRQMWRDMMLFHTAQFDDPRDKIDQARSIMHLVAHGTSRDDAAHRLAKEEVARRRGLSDSSIFHDDLAPVWQPFHFHEFIGLAERHGLQYLAEAAYAEMQAAGIAGEAAQVLQTLKGADRIRYEQYLDFFKLRRFRQTLLCRQDIDLGRDAEVSAMARFHYSARIRQVAPSGEGLPPDAQAWRHEVREVTVTTNDPAALAVLAAIARAWPASVSFDALLAQAGDRTRLCEILHTYFASAFVTAHALPQAADAAGDQVWRVARLEASLAASVPNLHHGSIELDDEAIRRLLPLFDGTRSRAELEAAAGGAGPIEDLLHKMARNALLKGP